MAPVRFCQWDMGSEEEEQTVRLRVTMDQMNSQKQTQRGVSPVIPFSNRCSRRQGWVLTSRNELKKPSIPECWRLTRQQCISGYAVSQALGLSGVEDEGCFYPYATI